MHNFRMGERILALVLAFVAGFIDTIGFIFLGGVFLSFMSGNTTRSATSWVAGDHELAILAGSCIVFFLMGVMIGALTQRISVRVWSITRAREMVLGVVSSIMIIASILVVFDFDRTAVIVVSVAVGAMNSIFERNGEVAIPLTYMTGTLVKMGQRFVDTFFGGKHIVWILNLALWLSLSAGAIIGAVLYRMYDIETVHMVTAMVVLATIFNYAIRERRRSAELPL